MTALEKLTLSRLEDRVTMLDATVQELVGRVELLEQVAWATADACGALLVRLEDLERQQHGVTG
jgi:ParB-like chromosome segregation protein Spo0J